ncbi:hypothetical protein FH972_024515 [Carpinus fangiana]|uniref:DUF7719 domain-containing protein n=1 Tax=Carpinus fangiana TaxID=176857 RepID=A0A5N6KYJ7_9ROSI|nr:hypothetical protein FH972_024515 [Carpinus fangiana]
MGTTRKQRRQAQPTADESLPTLHSSQIPMAQPDRSGPKGKTLYDLAAEREAELVARADKINAERTAKLPPDARMKRLEEQRATAAEEEREQEDLDHVLTTFTYAVTLCMLHFTLSVLVHHQYAQDMVPWSKLLVSSVWPLLPVLLVLIYLAHTRAAKRWDVPRQAVFAIASILSGCRLVRMGNEDAYLAVMKNAPPMGILWVWCVVEMKLLWGIGSLGAVAGWAVWRGYGLW